MTPSFPIADRPVGELHPPYIIAEAGVHHGNDLDVARQLIAEAARAGADAVKFQTYEAAQLAARWAPTYWDTGTGVSQHDVFLERSLFKRADYEKLFAIAAENHITLLSTPFDLGALEMLLDLGMAAIKVASADLTFRPLLDAAAATGRPVLLSTGASTYAEVAEAANIVTSHGTPLALLHCVLSYPTPVAQANLGRIGELRARHEGVVIGYSDHTEWSESALPCAIAVGVGARLVEKHFTLDRSLPGDDHYHAVDPAGLAQLVRDCRLAWSMSSNPTEMRDCEAPARKLARRSIVAARDLSAGTLLTAVDIAFKRPGVGLAPAEARSLIGRRVGRQIAEDELILERDVE